MRSYLPGDGPMYFAVSQKNRTHLARYEAGNAILSIKSEQDAEILVREFAGYWMARKYFFLGVFDKETDEFLAQIYIGPVNWDVPEFAIGYFVDKDHEGQGYVTEAVSGFGIHLRTSKSASSTPGM